MPRLTGKNEIRTRLRRDPAWTVHAPGELEQPMFAKTLWFEPESSPRIIGLRREMALSKDVTVPMLSELHEE